jgi:hypothetical protein
MMARMAWVFGAVIAVTLRLHIWSAASARREITKRIQPFVDDLFGSHLSKAIYQGEIRIQMRLDFSKAPAMRSVESAFPQLPMAWKS